MKNFIYIFFLFYIVFNINFSFWEKSLHFENFDWINTTYIKVKLDRWNKIITSVSLSWESLNDLVGKVWQDTWITWVYFCPQDYAWCNWQNSTTADRIFEWVSYSKYWPDTWARWLFWFDKNWNFIFFQNHLWYAEWFIRKYNVDKQDDIYYWLSNHPILIIDWKNVLSKEQDDLIDKKIVSKWTKWFICITKDENEVFMWYVYNIEMYELPSFLSENFWCNYALNLDAWKTSWLIYEWNQIIKENRKMMDSFVVFEDVDYKYLTQDQRNTLNWILTEYFRNIKKTQWIYVLYNKIIKLKENFIKKLEIEESWKKRAIIKQILYFLENYE